MGEMEGALQGEGRREKGGGNAATERIEARVPVEIAMDGFVQVNSGARPPADFFSADNINQIFATAQARV